MTSHHELLQDTLAQDRDVMRAIDARSPYVFRGKKNFRSRFLHDVIADHRLETAEVGNLAKVDLLYCSHALGKCGLFENVETNMIHEKDIRERYRAGTTPYEACAAYLMEHYGWSRELAHSYLVQSTLQDQFED